MKLNLLSLVAAATVTFCAYAPAVAQSQEHPATVAAAPAMATKTVYVCKACKTYFTPDAAKKMMYKDPMGHKLAKMAKAPTGYMDGSKMKMDSSKMDKGGKM